MPIEKNKMQKVSYANRAVRHVGLVAFMIFLAAVLGYVQRIILARSLNVEDFGLFFATFSFIMFLQLFRDCGFATALIKFVAEYNTKKDYSKIKTFICSALLIQLITSTVLILLLIIFSKYLAVHYFKSPKATILLVILCGYVLFSMFCNLIYHILLGFQEAKWYSTSDAIRIAFSVVAFWVLYYMGFGVYAAALSFVIGVALSLGIILIGARKYFFILKQPIKDFRETTKQLFAFALPSIFTSMAGKVVVYLGVLILTYFASLSEVGIYNVVAPTALLFIFFSNATSQVFFPLAAEFWSKHDFARLSESVRLLYTYSIILVLPFLLAAFVFAEFFIVTLFGTEYLSGVTPFRILLIGVSGLIIAQNNQTLLNAIGKPILVTKNVLIAAAVNILLNVVLTKPFGVLGASIATAAGYLTMFVNSTFLVDKYVPVYSPWKNWAKTAFCGGIFLLGVFSIKYALYPLNLNVWAEMIISSFGALVAYFFILYLMDLVNFKEIRSILQAKNNSQKG